MEEPRHYKSGLDTEKINLYMSEVLKKKYLLPNARYAGLSALGPAAVEKFRHANIELADTFDIYRGSKYYYDGRYKFIHYTSIPKLISIIREKKLRMYDLRGMDDKDEFGFAYKSVLRDSKFFVERIKPKVFCLSMCQFEVEEKKKSLNLWRQFGADGYGAGIVLEFNKRYRNEWLRYMLSKMHYGDKPLEKLRVAKEAYELFKKEHQFNVQNADQHFYKLFCFHKQSLYKDEMEVRFLYNEGFSDWEQSPKLSDLNGKMKLTSYHELEIEDERNTVQHPLYKNFGEPFRRLYPYVTIKAVLLGYRISDDNAKEIREAIDSYLFNYKHKPTITHTKLREHF